jgi:hypothetical protein
MSWLDQIVEWMDACESKISEPAFLKDEFPEWVKRLSRELVATLYPVAKLKVGSDWTARELGALLGHQLAYLHALAELPRIRADRVIRNLDRKAVAKARRQLKAFARCYEVALGRALALAGKQTYSDSREFFTAFAQALSRRPEDAAASNFHRTTTRVYWLLLLMWRSVGTMRSVRDLQQTLCRYLDTHVVGDVKRVEKICQRLGLQIAGRGRPRKGDGGVASRQESAFTMKRSAIETNLCGPRSNNREHYA